MGSWQRQLLILGVALLMSFYFTAKQVRSHVLITRNFPCIWSMCSILPPPNRDPLWLSLCPSRSRTTRLKQRLGEKFEDGTVCEMHGRKSGCTSH